MLSHLWIISLLLELQLHMSGGNANMIQTYCLKETFNATCRHDEVIMITHAMYGRMRPSRCVKPQYGKVGCFEDEKTLKYTDSKCSGRQSCSFPVTDFMNIGLSPCGEDVTYSFEASYSCVPVQMSNHTTCITKHKLPLKTPSGYIASHSTAGTRLGTSHCPWYIRVEPGQRINITLFDFGLQQRESGDMATSFCLKYASISEPHGEATVCAGDQRQRSIYESKTNQVEITIPNFVKSKDSQHYVIKYEAIGCPRLVAPNGSVLKVNGNSASITCNVSKETWLLTCKGTTWSGHIGTCSGSSGSMWKALLSSDWSSSQGILIVVLLGVGLGIIIGILMLGVAVIFLKRKGFVFACGSKSANEGNYTEERREDFHHYDGKYNKNYPGYSSDILLAEPGTADPRIPVYPDMRCVWAPGSNTVTSTMVKCDGRLPDECVHGFRQSPSDSQSLGHIYESPDFNVLDGRVVKQVT